MNEGHNTESGGSFDMVIDESSPVAPYQQLVNQVVIGIRQKALPAGSRLPAVRSMAAQLGLANNTVAKAYRQLEAEGHVETRGRNGTVVLGAEDSDELAELVRQCITAAVERGLSMDELMGLVRRHW